MINITNQQATAYLGNLTIVRSAEQMGLSTTEFLTQVAQREIDTSNQIKEELSELAVSIENYIEQQAIKNN